MPLSFVSHSAQETNDLGAYCAGFLQDGDVVLLTGDLGAGKTQFTQGVGHALDVSENIISPTFNILLIHEGKKHTLHHWDLYRIEHADELIDLDYFALISTDAISLVEWGDRFDDTSLDADLAIEFIWLSDQMRRIEIQALSMRGAHIIGALAGSNQVIDDE